MTNGLSWCSTVEGQRAARQALLGGIVMDPGSLMNGGLSQCRVSRPAGKAGSVKTAQLSERDLLQREAALLGGMRQRGRTATA
jgi:hypothetical protein